MANRLTKATSPYLLQHAENPVDWWEWGPEAFEEARRRDTPILLSVGYAACHWCHVVGLRSSPGRSGRFTLDLSANRAVLCRPGTLSNALSGLVRINSSYH
jgi:hypothetical protein